MADKKNTKKKTVARGPRRGVSAGLGTAGKRRVVSALPKSKAKNAYDLLSEISALIIEEPKRYNQGIYVSRAGKDGDPYYAYPSCGTIGCVAGWVTTLRSEFQLNGRSVGDFAKHILGLTENQACELFDGSVIDGRPQTVAYAKRGAAHIADFQEQYEHQLKAKSVIA